MTEEIKIHVENLWKSYGLPIPSYVYSAQNKINRILKPNTPSIDVKSRPPGHSPWILKDISFTVKKEEVLGIIGRNGAGKSTLLKLIAGITPPSRGKIQVLGNFFPMIELNAGIHMEFTGRENVLMLGAIMGFERKKIKELMPKIEEFCDLGEWFDRPVRMYSSGMLARLGFSVAINSQPDILLIDEVLAVGDVAFKNRCLEKIKELRETKGVTTLFVSHNLENILYLCNRVIVLDQGKIVFNGEAPDSVLIYENHQFNQLRNKLKDPHEMLSAKKYFSEGVILHETQVLDENGIPVETVDPYKGFYLKASYSFNQAITHPLVFTLGIINHRREVVINERYTVEVDEAPKSELEVTFHIPPVPLSGGTYYVNLGINNRKTMEIYTRTSKILVFTIEVIRKERGVIVAPVECIVKQNDKIHKSSFLA